MSTKYKCNELSQYGVLGMSKRSRKCANQLSPSEIKLDSTPSKRNRLNHHLKSEFRENLADSSVLMCSADSINCHLKASLDCNQKGFCCDGRNKSYLTENQMTAPLWYSNKTTSTILVIQTIYTLLFVALGKYPSEADAGLLLNSIHPILGGYEHEDLSNLIWEFFIVNAFVLVIVSLRIGVGRSFLSWEFLLITYMSFQWALIVEGLIQPPIGKQITVSIKRLIEVEFNCLAILISCASLAGKTSLLQLIVMQLLEVPLQVLLKTILKSYMYVHDNGQTMSSHMFGGFYGLFVSLVLFGWKTKKTKTSKQCSQQDKIPPILGTMVMIILWPCVSTVHANSGDAKRRAIVNTVVALMSAAVVSFPLSSILNPKRKFQVEYVKDSVMSAGIAVSSVSLMMVDIYGSVLIGSFCAAFCIFLRSLMSWKLKKQLRVLGVCHVSITHGVAGAFGGFASAILARLAKPEIGFYGYRMYEIYPARSPVEGSAALKEVQSYLSLPAGFGWSASRQAAMQVGAVFSTFILAVVGGSLTGGILRVVEMLTKDSNAEPTSDNYREGFETSHIRVESRKKCKCLSNSLKRDDQIIQI